MRKVKLIVHETYQGKRKSEDVFAAVFLSDTAAWNTGDGSLGTQGTVLCANKNLNLGRLVFTNRPFH